MIDVIISSCGRVDVLERTMMSLNNNVKTKDFLRVVLAEDLLIDQKRIDIRDAWIADNRQLFDEIHYSKKKLGYVRAYDFAVKFAESDIFLRLDDDTPFTEEVDIDEIMRHIASTEKICQAIFSRQGHVFVGDNSSLILDSGRPIIENDFYSVSTGLHKTSFARTITGLAGGECHESSILTPIMLREKKTSCVIGGITKKNATDDIGTKLGYIKGGWKDV